MSDARPTVLCPAKVNLALKVVGRRSDGYHELDTIFQAIDLCDTLRYAGPSDRTHLTTDDPGLSTGPENLVLRAARELERWSGRLLPGVALHLEKRIPTEGGLGGGSSDAAGALRLLCDVWSLAPGDDELHAMARRLGADVPFFLVGGTARGRGRGDRIERLPDLPLRATVLGVPPFGIPTGSVFAALGERLTLPSIGVSLPCFDAAKWPGDKDFSFAVNDLERVVFERWPVLAEFRDALRGHGANVALLSGSGSTVYGIFEDQARAGRTVDRLRADFPDWTIIPARAVGWGVRPAPS